MQHLNISLKPFLFVVVGLLFITNCAESFDDTENVQSFEITRAGRWRSPSLERQAAGYRIPYRGAGTWRGPSGCAPKNTFTPAARSLQAQIKARFSQVRGIGGYSCRKIHRSTSMSIHSTGRAMDIFIPLHRGKADNDKGDPVARWLLSNAQKYGIQEVIWDNSIWTSARAGSGLRYYGRRENATQRHEDHIHIALTTSAKVVENTCKETIKASGGRIDNTSGCFDLHGNVKYWRKVNNGYGGSLYWTNAMKSSAPSNWARWNLNFEKAGKYTVYYHSTAQYAKFNSVRYRFRANQKESDLYFDQSTGGDGWVELGTYDFAKGKGQWVSLYDNFSGEVARNQHIVADAIRVLPAKREGNGVKVTLQWTDATDLDIHVQTPNGFEISPDIDGLIAADGGVLAKDECHSGSCFGEGRSASNPHSEVVEWRTELKGKYMVWAENYNGKSSARFDIRFEFPDGTIVEKAGSVSQRKSAESNKYVFTVK